MRTVLRDTIACVGDRQLLKDYPHKNIPDYKRLRQMADLLGYVEISRYATHKTLPFCGTTGLFATRWHSPKTNREISIHEPHAIASWNYSKRQLIEITKMNVRAWAYIKMEIKGTDIEAALAALDYCT